MAAARVDESMTIGTLKSSEGVPSVASFAAASASSLPVMPLDWQWTGSTLFGGISEAVMFEDKANRRKARLYQ